MKVSTEEISKILSIHYLPGLRHARDEIDRLIREYENPAGKARQTRAASSGKTERIRAIQNLKATGLSQREVAHELGFALATVQRHWHTTVDAVPSQSEGLITKTSGEPKKLHWTQTPQGKAKQRKIQLKVWAERRKA